MILVTGATGLVGTHLLVKLVKEKQPVKAIYRTEKKKEQCRRVFSYYFNSSDVKLFDTIEWVQSSINDIPVLSEAFKNVTQVYHCAALISFNPSHYKRLRKINIEGTANIVNLCLTHNVQKLCHVSSIAALGNDPNINTYNETVEWNPEAKNSVYAITKYGAEMEVWRGTQEGLDAIIVNPGIIIGPGYFDTGSGYLFKKIHRGMKYYTSGTTGYIAVKDVTDIMYDLTNSVNKNERYILVAENLSFKTAFSLIAKSLDKPVPKKKISPFLMKTAFYLDLISHYIFITKRRIFRASIRSAFSEKYYENSKVKSTLNHDFVSIEKAIKETATVFLNQV